MSYGNCGMKPRLTPPIIPGTHNPEVTRAKIEAREAGREIARKVNENFKQALKRNPGK